MFRLLMAASLLVAAYGKVVPAPLPSTGGRIVGGEDAAIEDVPWQAGLILYDKLICGGSIISASVVISAAQCVIASGPSYTIIVGTNTNYESDDEQGQIADVSKVVVHPLFDEFGNDFDVSLFFLTFPLDLGANVAPIPLPAQNQVIADNTPAIASGWGDLNEEGDTPLLLQKVTIPIVNQDICKSRYNTEGWFISPRMICAGLLEEGGKDICLGDSGGPLVADGVLVGITSWGLGCARPGFPGVFTRVPALIDWINNEL